jgi:hypothetical protein
VYRTKLKETHTNSLTATTCSRMISTNGDLEHLTISIKYIQDFIDQMMDGPDSLSDILPSLSCYSVKHSSGKFILHSFLLPPSLELEIRELNPALTKFGFSTLFSRTRRSTNCSPLRLITSLTTIKNGTPPRTTSCSPSTRPPSPSSSMLMQTPALVNTRLET